MSDKSKKDLVLAIVIVIAVLSLASIACNDENGERITVETLATEAAVVADEVVDSLEAGPIQPLDGGHGDGICKVTGLNCK